MVCWLQNKALEEKLERISNCTKGGLGLELVTLFALPSLFCMCWFNVNWLECLFPTMQCFILIDKVFFRFISLTYIVSTSYTDIYAKRPAVLKADLWRFFMLWTLWTLSTAIFPCGNNKLNWFRKADRWENSSNPAAACFNWTFIPCRMCPVLLNLFTELTFTYILLSKSFSEMLSALNFLFYSSSGYFAKSSDWPLPRGCIGNSIHLHALLALL